jgi:hypothetical protein
MTWRNLKVIFFQILKDFFLPFFSSFSTLHNYIMLSMSEEAISHKRGARKIKKNSSIRYCKNQTQTRQSTTTKTVEKESKL